MTDSAGARPANVPENFQEYSDSRFGFSVWMPRRFEILQETIDPLARTLRGLHDLSEEEQANVQPRLPIGFWDPAVIGEVEEGRFQPLRLFEYEAIRGPREGLDDEKVEQMRVEIQDFMPETLASANMPGYEYLGVTETALGSLPALAFEYRWDGMRPGSFGGDHAFILWSMGPQAMYHVYHHCSGDQWEKRRRELEAILASFETFEPAAPEGSFEVFGPSGGGAETELPAEDGPAEDDAGREAD